jgi:hypothetical protein
MKRVAAVGLIAILLLPGIAWAGSSNDAALALGAFAALGTILLGANALSHAAIAAPPPVIVEPPAPPVAYTPPPVVFAPPPPPVVYAPPPPVVYAPAPRVIYAPPPVVYAPAPVYGYGPYVRHRYFYGYGHHWRGY